MPTPYFLRPNVRNCKPYTPGLSIEEIKEHYALQNVIKLASNENPLGTSPLVQKRVQEATGNIFRYIQSGVPKLVKAVATYYNVPENTLVLGNGSDEIIDLLLRAVPTPGEHNVVTCSPCFSMYTVQSALCQVEVHAVPLLPDFSFDWQGLKNAINAKTALVFLTTPDNPSGYCPPVTILRDFAKSLPPQCLLVIDEAYMDFCHCEAEHSLFKEFSQFSNLIFLRTFSKSFGLAGLRLGFGLMPSSLAQALCSIRPPFSINVLAEVAGLAVLEDTVFREKTLEVNKQGRDFLLKALSTAGCTTYPSQANFIMFTPPAHCPLTAQEIFTQLLEQGIIIRPLLSGYNLPNHLRVSIGTMAENTRFIQALQRILA